MKQPSPVAAIPFMCIFGKLRKHLAKILYVSSRSFFSSVQATSIGLHSRISINEYDQWISSHCRLNSSLDRRMEDRQLRSSQCSSMATPDTESGPLRQIPLLIRCGAQTLDLPEEI
jgi:hypothetical protein